MNATYLLSLLPLLACPVLMGGMMWLMMRLNTRQDAPALRDVAISVRTDHTGPDTQLAALHAQLDAIEAQQAALAAQLGQSGATVRPAGASGGREPATLIG